MTHWEVRLSGYGGQGIVTAGHIIGKAAALYDGKDAVMTEAYGPERAGGWSCANVIVSDEPMDYPLIVHPDILVAMSQEAFDKDVHQVKEGGLVLIEKTLVDPGEQADRNTVRVDAVKTADELGRRVVASIVMLGAFTTITGIITPKAVKRAVVESVPKGTEALNTRAFGAGLELGARIKEAMP